MPWYSGKIEVRDYLKKINQEKKVILPNAEQDIQPLDFEKTSRLTLSSKVLEYSLFQPGIFLNYLGFPHQTTNHILLSPQQFNFSELHVNAIEGHEDDQMAFTSIEDICNVVSRAVEYEGEWPVVGGIRGSRVTLSELLRIGEAVRGKYSLHPFQAQQESTTNICNRQADYCRLAEGGRPSGRNHQDREVYSCKPPICPQRPSRSVLQNGPDWHFDRHRKGGL
jgi:hypothetical protein